MKLGVITDGISRDLAHALAVMDEFGLAHAELQYVWDKQVGDLDAAERRRVRELLQRHGKPVACLSRHVFAGITTANRPGDPQHSAAHGRAQAGHRRGARARRGRWCGS